jgi:hypothetical protein
MDPLPTQDLRSNIATWSVPLHALPAATERMLALLPAEAYDPYFRGQALETTYFDTREFRLRQARKRRKKYLTLRIRCYRSTDTYALSAKTEDQKFRVEIDPAIAEIILDTGLPYADAYNLLPADLQARFLELCGDEPVVPVSTVRFHRYAVEDEEERLTLDADIRSDRGVRLPTSVLEQKSNDSGTEPFPAFRALCLRPLKLSKFLWSLKT